MDDLDDLFQAAKAAAPEPSAALVARVLADAAAGQPRPAAVMPAAPVRRAGWFARLSDAFGGRGVMAGLAGTAVAGLGLGFFAPALATDWPALFTAETVELIPDADGLFADLEELG